MVDWLLILVVMGVGVTYTSGIIIAAHLIKHTSWDPRPVPPDRYIACLSRAVVVYLFSWLSVLVLYVILRRRKNNRTFG